MTRKVGVDELPSPDRVAVQPDASVTVFDDLKSENMARSRPTPPVDCRHGVTINASAARLPTGAS